MGKEYGRKTEGYKSTKVYKRLRFEFSTDVTLTEILSRVCVIIDGVLDWRMDLLTTYRF
jgi:hypothetical protein